MATIDTATLIELWPIVPAIGSIATALYVVAKKAWKNEATMATLVATVCGTKDRPELGLVDKLSDVVDRLSKLEVQFVPFIKMLDDSITRMMLGSKGNPVDPVILRKIKMGVASVEEINKMDAEIAKDIEEQGPEAISLSVVRIWLALKKAELENLKS
jgi:hypothetical protein